MYDSTQDQSLLDRARAWGEFLLENRESVGGFKVWNTEQGQQPLTGFSHGISGIAYALSRLYSYTASEQFRDAAVEGFNYEDSAYLPAKSNWRDFRDHTSTCMDAWCHGRSGIVLARLDALKQLGSDDDLRLPVQDIESLVTNNADQLCCGNAGRADVLIKAAQLEEPILADRAEDMLEALVVRRQKEGCLSFPTHTPRIYNPTLFQGSSGVGYVILRLLSPSTVPCVLLGE